jgi:hypothetical protein
MEYIYGPLSSDFCIYFYFLSMFGFILFCFTVILGLYMGITKEKNFEFYFKTGMLCLAYLIFYFQNRLLYSMCTGKIVE